MVTSTESDPDFTDAFCGFLQRCVANVDAAELLLTLAKDPNRSWRISELQTQLAPSTVSDVDVERCMDALFQYQVVARDSDQRVRYRPSPAHDARVATLSRLYLERPVTLFRVIYALRDSKLRTFADAFKLRE